MTPDPLILNQGVLQLHLNINEKDNFLKIDCAPTFFKCYPEAYPPVTFGERQALYLPFLLPYFQNYLKTINFCDSF